MKKAFNKLLLFSLIVFSNISYGQNSLEDVVFLKNGSIIRGIILEQVPGQTLKIQTKDKNLFVFKFEEIERITKEELHKSITDNLIKAEKFKKNGYFFLTEIYFCPAVGNVKITDYYSVKNTASSYGFKIVNGYQLNSQLSLGIGLAVDVNKNGTLIPLTFDARASILKERITPVFNFSAGYSMGLDNVKGGLMINPSVGIKTYVLHGMACLFSLELIYYESGKNSQ